MKVEVNSTSLADAAAWTTRVIDSRPNSPILAGVKLEAKDGALFLSAFNYEISARDRIEAGVDEPGAVVVLGKLLTDISKMLPSEKTYLATEGSTLRITSGKSTFTMQLMPESEYPDLPQLPPQIGQVDAETFAQAVAQAVVAVSHDGTRQVLTAVRMQCDGERVTLSSTDRYRLSRALFHWTPDDNDINATALIRGTHLRDISRSLDEHQNVVISFDPSNPTLLGIQNAGRISTVQLIDGEFPAVDRLYADEYPIHAVVERQQLISAIKRVSLVAGRNEPIRMIFTGEEVTMTAGAADESQAREILDVDLDGEDITVAFNPNYLIEGISAITEPYVRMKMTTAVKPVEFDGQQEHDSDESMNYRYLLVPMRYNS
ncbi:DNA polymerase III subunit beta [Bifidobacterium gallicum]|uniref:Beta sliding clamp n=1 Tax=Bifidobacterium gallicum DSM 20093 = LMG 11596 TaxID=561180 RepID=D1NWD4_9BIFI|nr:DNA polymerase III subunit beta [Bifidobacterium gallicum]EFA22420.1 DNA polymerase III, beta subunit [Bifidobacterium gallicum DSM 20093 = LMG 11596]KFI60110.1 DNA polymerase III subunit beta [Bifidobacterium gallicum DSM 20093 = LMG 11596]